MVNANGLFKRKMLFKSLSVDKTSIVMSTLNTVFTKHSLHTHTHAQLSKIETSPCDVCGHRNACVIYKNG